MRISKISDFFLKLPFNMPPLTFFNENFASGHLKWTKNVKNIIETSVCAYYVSFFMSLSQPIKIQFFLNSHIFGF